MTRKKKQTTSYHNHIYRYKLKAAELAAAKLENHHVLFINTERTIGIWLAAILFYFVSLIYGICALLVPPIKPKEPDWIPHGAPSSLTCNYSTQCEYAWNACILGDWTPSCRLNVTSTPTMDSKNCGLIIPEALNNPATLPESVIKFLNLYGQPPPASPPPPTQQMTNLEMQQAVTFTCNLIFKFVRCTCVGCQVCRYPQGYCTTDPSYTAQEFCSNYTKMGFSDAPIYNGPIPYFAYPWLTPLNVQQQQLFVDPGYRTGV